MIPHDRYIAIYESLRKKTEPEKKNRIPGYLETCRKENKRFLWVNFGISDSPQTSPC